MELGYSFFVEKRMTEAGGGMANRYIQAPYFEFCFGKLAWEKPGDCQAEKRGKGEI